MPNGSVRLLAQETTFYLRIDPVQPPLGMVGLLLVRCDLGLKLLDPVFCSVKLMRQLLRSASCLPIVCPRPRHVAILKYLNRLQFGLYLGVTFGWSYSIASGSGGIAMLWSKERQRPIFSAITFTEADAVCAK